MNLTDVLIHISSPIGPADRTALEQQLREIPGVIAPRFNPGQERQLLIAYDPEETTSHNLLKQVYSLGYDGSLVGL